jgi:cytochrome c-type biogenesis protein CcmH/NrfG
VLLDRKRIDKWAKVVAAGMAIIFGLSFVFLGVGSGLGFNISSLWSGGGSKSSAVSGGPEEKIKAYQEQLKTDPKNVNTLLAVATQYELQQAYPQAAQYLEQAAAAAPTRADIQLRLATIYLNQNVNDYKNAVRALNKATSLDPTNADAFLRLGVAERGANNPKGAVLAWTKYLELSPTGDMAQTIRTELTNMQAQTATATAGAATTTGGGQTSATTK